MGFANLTIDHKKIKQNIASIKDTLPSNSKLLLVAKANAYGLGAIEICRELKDCINYIGVSTVREAAELRENGIHTPILLLSEPFPSELDIVSSLDITITIYDKSTIELIDHYTSTNNKTIKTHLKVDTGMTRLGTNWEDAKSIMNQWQKTSKNVIKEGIYSHYANSNNKSHPLNQLQQKRFHESKTESDFPLSHFSNSDGVTHFNSSDCNLVRIGLSVYNDAFTLKAPLRLIKTIKKGTSVGYGSTFTATETTRVGVIGMGYADGLSTQLSNQGYVDIDGHNCPIIGQICMCMFMVKLPPIDTITVDHLVTIISPDNQNGMSLKEFATITNQNPREVMTRFSNRVTRIHLS